MQTKASANHTVRSAPSSPFAALTVAASSRKEKTNEAARKPSTNFGTPRVPSPIYGRMFWFSRKKFVGSYLRLSARSRSYLASP